MFRQESSLPQPRLSQDLLIIWFEASKRTFMPVVRIAANSATLGLPRIILVAAVFCFSSHCAFAGECPVLHHGPPTDADKALLAADYSKAEDLYSAALATNHSDVGLTVGFVHALLRDQKVQEAAD